MNSLYVIIASAAPISELRGGIPLAISLGFSPLEAYILSILGNFLPVPLLLVAMEKLLKIASRVGVLWNLYEKIEARVERRRELIEKYGYLGLVIFVAIPLPVTGAWTACLLAFLLNLSKLKSTLSIFAGICIAGVVVISPIIGLMNFIK